MTRARPSAAAVGTFEALSWSSGERACSWATAGELQAGTRVAGKYRIKSVLGRGGFAVVYAAEHLELMRDVALKVLHRTHDLPDVLLERFAREVRISALVRHPHVLEVYDAGVLEDGSPFLAMEQIRGLTLHEKLCSEPRLSIAEAIRLADQLLSAIVALFEHGIVHRDIKPENLMLTHDANGELRLKLVDFGIARVHHESGVRRLTMDGALVGTPHYMAPEQLRCEGTDVRTDLYATGVVLYQALTGRLPHDAPDLPSLTLKVLHGHAEAVEKLRPDCPERLSRLVARAMCRDPELRFRTASAMREELARCRRRAWLARLRLGRWSEAEGVRWPRGLLGAVLATAALAVAFVAHDRGPLFSLPEQGAAVAHFELNPSQPLVTPLAPPRQTMPVVEVQLAPKIARADVLAAERDGQSGGQRVSAGRHHERGLSRRLAIGGEDGDDGTTAPRLASDVPPQRPTALDVSQQPAAAQASGSRREEALPPRQVRGAAEPEALRALSRNALRLYLHGEIERAFVAYSEAARRFPEDTGVLRGLGLAASQLGYRAAARHAFLRYLELAPQAADASSIRERLRAL